MKDTIVRSLLFDENAIGRINFRIWKILELSYHVYFVYARNTYIDVNKNVGVPARRAKSTSCFEKDREGSYSSETIALLISSRAFLCKKRTTNKLRGRPHGRKLKKTVRREFWKLVFRKTWFSMETVESSASQSHFDLVRYDSNSSIPWASNYYHLSRHYFFVQKIEWIMLELETQTSVNEWSPNVDNFFPFFRHYSWLYFGNY